MITRDYVFRSGGGCCPDDYWYDEEIVTVKEGDTCPECKEGVMKVSRNNKLYCSKICWKKEEETERIDGYIHEDWGDRDE